MLAKAESMPTPNVLDRHFFYSVLIDRLTGNSARNPEARIRLIESCESQIAIAAAAAKAFKTEDRNLGIQPKLPYHTGYSLLVDLIRDERPDEAKRLASQAKKQGWQGNW